MRFDEIEQRPEMDEANSPNGVALFHATATDWSIGPENQRIKRRAAEPRVCAASAGFRKADILGTLDFTCFVRLGGAMI